MSYANAQMAAVISAMEKYRGGDKGEVGAALVVVGLSAIVSAVEHARQTERRARGGMDIPAL